MPYLNTPSLFDAPYQHSETSRDAAVRATAFCDTQRERYYRWLASKPQGGTDGDAEVEIPMRRSSVCARRAELMKRGRVVKTDRRHGGCAIYTIKET